jgi:hypothetical protein
LAAIAQKSSFVSTGSLVVLRLRIGFFFALRLVAISKGYFLSNRMRIISSWRVSILAKRSASDDPALGVNVQSHPLIR